MKQKIDKKTQVKILDIIEKWMYEHGYPCGETICQNDECTIDSVDLASELGDIYSELYESQSK